MPNIILIGLTGSGKSTIGKDLAKRLNLSFIDMDDYIEKKAGKTIPELFKEGEMVFRSLETEACRELAKETDSVISTGGGAVVKTENHSWLKKAGKVIWIDRPIDLIASDIETDHRPLLKDGVQKLYQLYDERQHLYAELADLTIKNNQPLETIMESLVIQLEIISKKGENS